MTISERPYCVYLTMYLNVCVCAFENGKAVGREFVRPNPRRYAPPTPESRQKAQSIILAPEDQVMPSYIHSESVIKGCM